MKFVVHIVMYMLGLTYVLQSTCVHHSYKTILICINANLHGKLPPVAQMLMYWSLLCAL